ncbi:MAG TPA: cytochrome c [Caulobacterales bacterium]|nr:cytochrome c [Caulobacterales bacterium]
MAPVAHAQDGASQIEQGHQLAQAFCSRCHAIGLEGESTHPQAPPFRTLSRNYPVNELEEAFAEGVLVGHPDMPQFEFQPDQIDALVAYLQSIQPKRAAQANSVHRAR